MKKKEYRYNRRWIMEQLKDVNPNEVFTYNIVGPLIDRPDITLGIATVPRLLHSKFAIGAGVAFVGPGRAVIMCDAVHDEAPDNVRGFLELHEIGHLVNGHLEKMSQNQVLATLKRFLPWSAERKNEYEADMYAVSKIGKKDVLYGLEYLYRMVDFPLSTKLELRSRINNVIKNG